MNIERRKKEIAEAFMEELDSFIKELDVAGIEYKCYEENRIGVRPRSRLKGPYIEIHDDEGYELGILYDPPVWYVTFFGRQRPRAMKDSWPAVRYAWKWIRGVVEKDRAKKAEDVPRMVAHNPPMLLPKR